ncbi:hypothetical protein OU995_19920 [Roseateles sp. SL47]|uniref:hypothetical protein n=1 Tax=Roseateles sp. SL47 TaxID=2995138 RepID=UPI002270920B|nr:hypothetical protein [Roseateles sp. SL47]WAC71835.1 hypothetical protein OU995_19920 [Roseateles sp. SL47]
MTRQPQRGASTLLLCSLLLMVLGLAGLWSARHLGAAQRMAATDQRAAMAVQAADAGLAWASAMLNTGRIDNTCRPTFNSGQDLRERALRTDANGHLLPAPGRPAVATCINIGAQRWDCRCDGRLPDSSPSPLPSSSPSQSPSPTPAPPRAPQPSFAIRFTDTDTPGQLSLISRGCSEPSPACADPDLPPPDSTGLAEHSQHLALLSALRRPPASPLVEGNNAFVRVFGYPSSQYRLQPALTRLRCGADCGPELRQAFARGRRLIWIDGSVTLREAPPMPASQEPVVLLVDGQLNIQTAMDFSGVLYARSGIHWQPPVGSRSLLRGAVITEGQLIRPAAPTTITLEWDADLLNRISRQMGSYLPVPGGWSTRR